MKPSRRDVAAGLAASAACSLTPALAQQKLIPFKVGMAAPANTFLSLWMAQEAGFYPANGLDYSIFDMVGGAEAGPTLSSGKIQLMHIGLSSVIRANAAGADLRVIGSLSNIVRFTLFAKPGVTGVADLKGGTFGISSPGSESDVTIDICLEKLGLTRRDIVIKDVGSGGRRLAAIRSGEVTAATLNEPYRSEAFETGLKPLVDLVPERTPWLFSGLVADAAYIKSNRDALLRFLRATVEGNYLAVSNEERGKTALANALKIKDKKVLDISYRDFQDQSPLNAEATREAAMANIARVAAPGAKKEVEAYCDLSLSEDLRKEGFFDAMKSKYKIG